MSNTQWGALKQTADDATKPLEIGKYQVKCTKADAVQASTGSPMIKVILVVQGGPKHGKSLFNNFVLTMDNGFALAMFFRHMSAFGLDDNFFATLPDDINAGMPLIAKALEGREAMADVGIRTSGNFAGRNDFNGFDPVSGPGGSPSMPGVGPGFPNVGPVGTSTPVVPTGPSATPGVPSMPLAAPPTDPF